MKKRILCFGDSNTFGAIPGGTGRHDDETRWAGVMQKELGEEYLVLVEGHNGRTSVFTDPIEHRMSGLDYFYPCMDSQSPLDLVIVMLGTNDLKPRFGANAGSIARALQNYADVLKIVPMAGEKPKLLMVSPILIDPAYRDNYEMHYIFGEDADVRSRELALAIERAAAEIGADFFNAADIACASLADGVHMDPASHRKLGLAMADKVRELLG